MQAYTKILPVETWASRPAGSPKRAGLGATLATVLCVFAAWPTTASGAMGPPAGPTTPPFTQCPAVSADTSCQFLVDVVGSGSTQTPVVIQDPSQPFYDSNDDALVAVQNDSGQPLASLHIGVEGSGDNDFGFDGDGLCAPPTPPVPAGCPFGGSLEDPFDYAGPGMEFEGGTAALSDADAGTVDFTPALQPGQYTYFSLEAEPNVPLVAGNVNDLVTTTLSDAGGNTSDMYGALQEAEPTEVTDTATIAGANASSADGTATYRVYSDPACTQLVATAGTGLPVDEGTATPSNPVGPGLPNNSVYYWQVSYSGDASNSPSVSPCGSETMIFGSPPARAQSGVSASFTGNGQTATALTVPAGASATAGAQITGAGGAAATGSVTYTLYSDNQCTQQAASAGTVAVVNGSAAPSAPLALADGTYYLVVSYSGDAHHASLTSGCGVATLTVGGSAQAQECNELASLDPGFATAEKSVVPLPSLSSDTLAVSLSAGVSLGSVGICDNALSGLVPGLGGGGLGLTANYSLTGGSTSKKFTYSFVPLGWHIPAGTGAPDATPPPPAIEWPQAIEFGGEVHPSLSFTYTPGEALTPSLDLIEVPIAQTSVTLLALGSPFLQASVGPELSFGLSFDKKELAEQENEDVAEGESPETAAQEISDELGSDVEGGLENEVGAIDPDAPDMAALETDSTDAASTVAGDADATLPGDPETGVDDTAISGGGDAALDGGADAAGGDELLDVLIDLAFAAEAHRPPPPSLVATSGQLLAQRLLPARPLARLSRRALHRTGFPRGRVPALVRDRLALSVPAKVRPLVASSTRLLPGHRISILATRLGRGRRHDALIVLQGPGYRATRLVRVVRGAANATIALPRSLARGTWTISVQDLSEVHLSPSRTLAGYALVRFGVFSVSGHGRGHRHGSRRRS
jgi:hypothetical protein